MGASAKIRKGKKKAQAAYFAALTNAERLNPLKRIDTNSATKLQDAVGDDFSYGSKRLAMQADKLAKKINADDTFQKDVGKYNARYDEIKRQMNGESFTKTNIVKLTDTGKTVFNQPMINRQVVGGFHTGEVTNPAKIQNNVKSNFGPQDNKSIVGGLLEQAKEPTFATEQVVLHPINYNYRSLPQTSAAYEDLERLSKPLASSAVNKYAESYEALAEKLKGRLKREVNTSPKTNLNSPDVLTGAPVQNVIR